MTLVLAAAILIAFGLYAIAQSSSQGASAISSLSASQIQNFAALAGFQGDDLNNAVAVAQAESGGNPMSYNPETEAGSPAGEGSYGLWQIYLRAHPEFAGWNLYDPLTNAKAAYSVYLAAGSSFAPWSTYKNNAYLAFLNGGTNV